MKKASALTLISALLFSTVAGIQLVNLAKANWIPYTPKVPSPLPPTISILSPENNTYNSKDVTLNFAVTVSLQDDVEIRDWDSKIGNWTYRKLQSPQDRAEINQVFYYLDGVEHNITIPAGSASLNWSTTLRELSEGTHTIKVNASGRYAATVWIIYVSLDSQPLLDLSYKDTAYSDEVWSYSEITFTTDATSPNISILSPTNSTYRQTIIPLNFTINEPVLWMGYSLDGQDNVTITGNTTLPELAYGLHNLTIYAQDSAGYIVASETICFSIEPFPTTLVIASIASVAIAGAILVIYFKKRNH